MRPLPLLLLLQLALFPGLATAQDRGYFGEGEKQLTFREEGSRSTNEKIALASIFGAALLTGTIGTYYLLDSKNISDELSASGTHTGLAWSAELEARRQDGLRSGTVAKVSLSISGALVLAGIVTFIVTEPDEEIGYQDWQTRSFVVPTRDGILAGQGWTF